MTSIESAGKTKQFLLLLRDSLRSGYFSINWVGKTPWSSQVIQQKLLRFVGHSLMP
jgi:hypothetical protein